MDVSHAAFTPKKSHRTHPLATIALLTITMIHSAAGCDPVTFKSLYNYDINMVATELMQSSGIPGDIFQINLYSYFSKKFGSSNDGYWRGKQSFAYGSTFKCEHASEWKTSVLGCGSVYNAQSVQSGQARTQFYCGFTQIDSITQWFLNPNTGSNSACYCLYDKESIFGTFNGYSIASQTQGTVTLKDSSILVNAAIEIPLETSGVYQFEINQNFADVFVPNKKFKVVVSCMKPISTAKQSMTFNKNSGIHTIVNDLTQLFSMDAGCSVDDFDVTFTNHDPITANNYFYYKALGINIHTTPSTGPFQLDTLYEQGGYKTYAVILKITTSSPEAQSLITRIPYDLNIQCALATSLTIQQVLPAHSQLVSYTPTEVIIIVAATGRQKTSFPLNLLYTFTTDVPYCSDYRIEGYKDLSKTIKSLSTDNLYIEAMSRDYADVYNSFGNIARYTANANNLGPMYLRYYSFFAGGDKSQAVVHDLKFVMQVCETQPALVSTGPEIIEMIINTPTVTIDITQYFKPLTFENPVCEGVQYYQANAHQAFSVVGTNIIIDAYKVVSPLLFEYVVRQVTPKCNKYIDKKINFNLRVTCPVSLTPLQPEFIFTLQKNHNPPGNHFSLASIQDLDTKVTNTSPYICKITEWTVTEVGSSLEIPAGHHLRLNVLRSKYQQNLVVITTTAERTFTFEFELFIKINDLSINSQKLKMKVILYCNIFTQSYSFKETHQWYWKTVSGVPQMVVPVTKVGANVNQFNLTDVQVYTSQYSGCDLINMASYQDAAGRLLTTQNDQTRFVANPTEQIGNQVAPLVEIKYTDVNDPLTLYYKNDIDPTVHLIRFQTCKDKISLVSPTYSLSGFDYLAQSIDLNQLSNVITALVPPVSVCQVRSYKVLNVTAVSQGTMIADGLKVSGNQLLVAQGIVGVYSFVIEVKLDNSLMTSTIQAQINSISTCWQPIVLPIKSSVHFQVQQYKKTGDSLKVDLATSVSRLFDFLPNNNCKISHWYVSSDIEGQKPITDSSPIGQKLLLADKKGTNDDPLQSSTLLDTTISSFQFYLQTYLYYNSTVSNLLNQQAIKVNVSVGCFEERLSGFWIVKVDSILRNVTVKVSDEEMVLTYPRPISPTVVRFNLSQVFQMRADYLSCGAIQISAHADSTRASAPSGNIWTTQNPAISTTNNTLDSEVVFRIYPDIDLRESIYLTSKAKNEDADPVYKSLKLSINSCNDKPILLSGTKMNMQVDMLSKYHSLDLRNFIQYESSSSICNNSEYFLTSIDSSSKQSSSPQPTIINSTTLQIPSTTPRTHTLQISLKSLTSFKQATMTLEVQVINSLPTFQQPLPSLIPVTISIDDSNKIVQGPLFTYVAPPIVDLERHKVEVVVKWDKEMDYASASVVMGQVVVVVDRTMVKESGSLELQVWLGDEFTTVDKVVPYSIKFQIEIQRFETSKAKIQNGLIDQINAKIDTEKQERNQESWDGWKQLMASKRNQTVPEGNQETIKPLKLKVKIEFLRNQTMEMKFNQEIMVPERARRKLLEFDQFNVTSELLSLVFEFNDPTTYSSADFNITLIDWQPTKILFGVNFKDLQTLTRGKLIVTIKHPEYFVSQISGIVMEEQYAKESFVVFPPQQLPHGFDSHKIQETAETTSNMVTVLIICQIVFQILLKGSVKTLIDLFQAIQMMVYTSLFNLQMSAITEMILAEFKKLIEFQMLNPEKFIQQVYDEDFTIKDWMTGVKSKIVSKDQQQSLLDDCLVYIMIASIFLFVLLILCILKFICYQSLKNKIKQKLDQILKQTIWNGLIMSLKISLFRYCFSIGNQIKLIVYDSEYLTTTNLVSSAVLIFVLIGIMLGTARFLWKNYSKLDRKETVQKCGNLYVNAPYNRDRPYVYRFPLLILHRLCFAILASGLHRYVGQSIQLVMFGNLLFTMFWLNYRPSASQLIIRLESLTVSGLHMSLILIVTQTTFVLSIEAQTLYGFIFLGSFSLIVTINLLVIIYLSIATLLRRKRRLLDAMWRAVYEKGWLCCCGKMVVRKSKWVAGKEKETKEVEVEAEVQKETVEQLESEKKSEHGGFMIRGETGLTMSFGNPYSLHRINLPAPKPYTFSKPSYPQASKYLINNRFKQPPNITKVIQPITKKPKQEDTDSSLDDDHKREQNPIDQIFNSNMANQMMPETLEAISKGSLFAMNLNMLALDEEEEALRQEYKRLKRIIKSKKAAFSVIKYNLDLVRAEYRVRMQVIKQKQVNSKV